MLRQKPELVSLLQPVIAAMGYELWGVEYLPGGPAALLRIYIDKASGITLDDCARVSDQVEGVLDVHDPIRGRYTLEVSSPGVDRPLFTLEQFGRYLGQPVKLRLSVKQDGRKNLAGVLVGVSGDTVQIRENDQLLNVPAGLIEKASLRAQLDGILKKNTGDQ
jgi:ribosome maturation factor RimP